jgi:hypothetical protein
VYGTDMPAQHGDPEHPAIVQAPPSTLTTKSNNDVSDAAPGGEVRAQNRGAREWAHGLHAWWWWVGV